MTRSFALLCTGLMLASAAAAAPKADPVAPVRQFIDGFNSGDTKTAFAAFAAGDIAIIDEFAPHYWHGPKAPQAWAADFDSHAKATGVTDPKVSYGNPTRNEVSGTVAYVIVPTVYTYKEKAKAMAEEGQMTFALKGGKAGWKIAAWTWSGVKPHAAK